MKRFLLSVIAMITVIAACAQKKTIVSPQVNEDYTVTFRLKAPKAVKVEVSGDFLPREGTDPALVPVKAEMTEATIRMITSKSLNCPRNTEKILCCFSSSIAFVPYFRRFSSICS